MTRKKGKKQAPRSRSHATKTREEKDAYAEKVKLTDAQGETLARVPDRTSTLSTRSVYSVGTSGGIPDRNRINPPQAETGGSIGKIAAVVTILSLFAGVIIWLTTVKNTIDFNSTEITELKSSIKHSDGKRDDLNTRLTTLEQWRDALSQDLDELRDDIASGMSKEQVELKLMELEARVLGQLQKS